MKPVSGVFVLVQVFESGFINVLLNIAVNIPIFLLSHERGSHEN